MYCGWKLCYSELFSTIIANVKTVTLVMMLKQGYGARVMLKHVYEARVML